ncbi:unnamed protein product [Owenia fusiformis]|uniref:Uncharacterized protein n=1 Tax=Owenia fusiformis TaxID=6347 RepID=A0A8S4PSL6_OWEFU|nr:unnamed protein product [Owenia fusiformis]
MFSKTIVHIIRCVPYISMSGPRQDVNLELDDDDGQNKRVNNTKQVDDADSKHEDVNIELDRIVQQDDVENIKQIPADIAIKGDNKENEGEQYHHQQQHDINDDETKTEKDIAWHNRADIMALIGGIAFIIVLIGAIFAMGGWREWDAPSGYFHNVSVTSMERFLPEPYILEPGVRWRDSPGAAGRWYYWKLPTDRVTIWSRLFMWIAYFGHQLTIWCVTYAAQMAKASRPKGEPKYTVKMDRFNWISLGLNVVFHIVHFVNTHTTYDGIAQDTVTASSQGSVIMAIGLILFMEYNEKGFIMGWPMRRDTDRFSKFIYRAPLDCVYVARKYHGYAISWAAIYTFWFHPMENTYGHALGFIHTWIILLQGSLMHTKFHQNRWWRFILQSWMLLHGAMVAFQTGDPSKVADFWPMFLFGFACLLALSWIYILPFWNKISGWFRFIPPLVFIGIMVGSYSQILDQDGKPYTRMAEVIRIPGFFFATFFIFWVCLKLFIIASMKINGPLKGERPSSCKTIGNAFGFFIIYGAMIGISIIFHIIDLASGALMFIMIPVYFVGVAASTVNLQQMIPSRFSDVNNTTGDADADLSQVADEQRQKGSKYKDTYVINGNQNEGFNKTETR